MTRTILIVDDRPDDALLTEMALKEALTVFRIESVTSGERALEHLRQMPELPSIILMDLKMPGIGGLETVRRIRADDRLKDIPVLILTGSTLESDVLAAREAGATGFVHKNIRLNQFSKELVHSVNSFIAT